jgi:ABC-type uncharacterized transport system substrate-binding protein
MVRIATTICIFVCGILFFCPATILAHPHVFVDCSLTLVFDEKGFAGIRNRWVFDEMFSGMMFHDFDKDKDFSLNPQEVAAIKTGAFSNLKNFNYFNHLKIGDQPFAVKFVKDFHAEIDVYRNFTGAVGERSLVYSFFVPCHVSAHKDFKQIRIAVFDEEYYTDIALAPGEIAIEGNSDSFIVEYSKAPARDLTYYYGQIVPEAISLKYRMK